MLYKRDYCIPGDAGSWHEWKETACQVAGEDTGRQPGTGKALFTCWLLQLMEDYYVMWVIEVLSQDGDFQAIEPICTENGLILQIGPEYLVLWNTDVKDREPEISTHDPSLRA